MILVVGAGLSGAVIAERAASMGMKVLVIDKRPVVGGNCYDFISPEGLLIPKYGPHFFHTNDVGVWEYVQKFSEWHPYEHRVLSFVEGKYVPVPVNATTVNILCDQSIKDEAGMKRWIQENTVDIPNPKNSEESALRRVGPFLYEKMFKGYTEKQWGMEASKLAPEVMDRVPVRIGFDDRYFDDRFQAVPSKGYTYFIESLLKNKNIEVRTETDYFDVLLDARMTFFTGRIDQYFARRRRSLDYRSVRFQLETWSFEDDQPGEFILPATTVNYPGREFEFTRVTEPKRATGQKHSQSILIREYPSRDGEPCYPILDQKNRKLFSGFQLLAEKEERNGVFFVGRLANYKYFNMDQAIRNALNTFSRAFPPLAG